MTREKIKNKLFDIILKNSSPTMVVKRTIDYQQTMVIVEELINHETDLLKEFVEWLKDKLDKQVAHLKNSDEFDLERSIGIHIVLVNLDNHLVKFLETKDERQSP